MTRSSSSNSTCVYVGAVYLGASNDRPRGQKYPASFSSLPDLADDHLRFKEETCLEILKLLEMLDAGQCKMRGLVLFELFCCRREKNRRKARDDEKASDAENRARRPEIDCFHAKYFQFAGTACADSRMFT